MANNFTLPLGKRSKTILDMILEHTKSGAMRWDMLDSTRMMSVFGGYKYVIVKDEKLEVYGDNIIGITIPFLDSSSESFKDYFTTKFAEYEISLTDTIIGSLMNPKTNEIYGNK